MCTHYYVKQTLTYSLFPCTFFTSSLVLAIAASIFPRKSEIFSSSDTLSWDLLLEVLGVSGDCTGDAKCDLLSGAGIKRYSRRKRLSLAHNLLALLICSIYK